MQSLEMNTSPPIMSEGSAFPLTTQPQSSQPAKDAEKTIPFLRQLTEMLQENSDVISFIPGRNVPGQIVQGKIVVHDRNRVQTEVLPTYFNHASFASLRRQLSYFSFVRVGKGRHGGVTYTNENVYELSDILKLKRRTAGGGGGASKQQHQQSMTADVASAVSSGILHAAKTNSDVVALSSTAKKNSSMCRTSNTTQSSTSQSATSLDNGFPSKPTASASGIPRNISPPNLFQSGGPFKKLDQQGKVTSNNKITLPRKRAGKNPRLDRLLYVNNIVPFIHLPERKFKTPSLTDLIVEISEANSSPQMMHQEPPSKKALREEPHVNEDNDNTCKVSPAIHALLALGCDVTHHHSTCQ